MHTIRTVSLYFDVLVADVCRPHLLEGIITDPPYNLHIVKSGKFAWIVDPTKSLGQSLAWIVDPTKYSMLLFEGE